MNNNKIILKKHDFNIDYEKLMRELLIMYYGIQCKDFLITKQDILYFEELILEFIDNLSKN